MQPTGNTGPVPVYQSDPRPTHNEASPLYTVQEQLQPPTMHVNQMTEQNDISDEYSYNLPDSTVRLFTVSPSKGLCLMSLSAIVFVATLTTLLVHSSHPEPDALANATGQHNNTGK